MTGWTPQYPTNDWVPPVSYGPLPADPLISPDYSGWWGRGVAIVRRGWKPIALVQLIGLVVAVLIQAPLAVYAALVSDDIQRGFTTTNNAGQVDLAPLFGLFGFTIVGALLGVLVTGVVTLAVVHVGASVAIGAPVRIGDSLRLALRRVMPLIGWQLLAVPIYLAGLCLCVLPVFYVFAVMGVLPIVVAVERTNAIGRCFTLFHRDFGAAAARMGTIIGMTIVITVVGGLFGSIVQAVASAALSGHPDTAIIVGTLLSTLVGAVLGGAAAILVAPLTLTAYADMRARVEPTNALAITQALGIAGPAFP